MAVNPDKAIVEFNKAVQNFNRQIRHTNRFTASQIKLEQTDLEYLEASLNDYLGIVESNYKTIVQPGNAACDDTLAICRSTYEKALVALRTIEDRPAAVNNSGESFDESVNIYESANLVDEAPGDAVDQTPLLSNANELPLLYNNSSASSRRTSVSAASSNQSIQCLAEAISQSMRFSRIGPLDVEVFSGNPLEFVGWEVAFKNLFESPSIPSSDRPQYLKPMFLGPPKKQ